MSTDSVDSPVLRRSALLDKFLKCKDRILSCSYKDKGSDYNGVDCLGLIILVLSEVGIDIDNSDSFRDPFNSLCHIGVDRVTEYKFLDVLLFKDYTGVISHCGLYLSQNQFIHASETLGIRITKIDSIYKKRLEGIYRLRCIND